MGRRQPSAECDAPRCMGAQRQHCERIHGLHANPSCPHPHVSPTSALLFPTFPLFSPILPHLSSSHRPVYPPPVSYQHSKVPFTTFSEVVYHHFPPQFAKNDTSSPIFTIFPYFPFFRALSVGPHANLWGCAVQSPMLPFLKLLKCREGSVYDPGHCVALVIVQILLNSVYLWMTQHDPKTVPQLIATIKAATKDS